MFDKLNTPDLILPNTFIVGVAKCGTTSIFDWLADHPEVCASSEKEVYYLCDKVNPLMNRKLNFHTNGLDGYGHYFGHYESNKHKIILEGSPSYFYEQTPLEVIPTFNPHAKIIILLRKSSDRIYSSYQFARNTMAQIDQNISFPEFIQKCREYADVSVLDHQSVDTLAYNSIEGSKYSIFMQKWLASFDIKNIHVYLSDEFIDSSNLMKRISKDLGINPSFWDTYDFERKMETYLVRNQTIHRMVLSLYRRHLMRLPRGWTNGFEKWYMARNTSKLPSKQNQDKEILRELDAEFVPYNEELERMLGIDLSVWQ
jgi:hypothetical protein